MKQAKTIRGLLINEAELYEPKPYNQYNPIRLVIELNPNYITIEWLQDHLRETEKQRLANGGRLLKLEVSTVAGVENEN